MKQLIELIIHYCELTNYKIDGNTIELIDLFNHALQMGYIDMDSYNYILQTMEVSA